ncbi:flagellin [Aquisalimonas lutea]|uniref:flagellin N-terminal helical domain-containing protein n=1 Tax=Aquisalimonas lutea TaxID=1327750 RepID=UPI0025B50853|nr:flagellin [Aquisalimonas lutea]MDN3518272.1 flagellin [Aquisalimonas lutea]
MSQVINTNIASLNAQRNLSNSQDNLNTALERLSSGLRINSAKDDAAGLAIAERFTAQIRGMDQATRNANDGISFAQTAEGALGEIGNALQRIRELSVQSANDTNSATDRQALNNEVQELVDEVNRISDSAQFNGQNILDGTLEDLVFQVGANANQTISVDGVDARGTQLGARVAEGEGLVGVDYDADLTDDLSINGVSVDLSGIDANSDVNDVISAINNVSSDSEVTARQASETTAAFTYAAPTGTGESVSINDVEIGIASGATIDTATAAINDASSQTGVTATNDGTNIRLTSSSSSFDLDDADGVLSQTATGINVDAGIVLEGPVGEDITTSATGDSVTLNIQSAANGSGEDNTVNTTNVLTREDANTAIQTMDAALQQVNGLRAELGAVQTRFESTIANLEIGSENLQAARSRIQDADFAAETAALTKGQILQQAGTSVLAQANQLPQNTLSLLQ